LIYPWSAAACCRLGKLAKTKGGSKLPHSKGFASDNKNAAFTGTVALPASV